MSGQGRPRFQRLARGIAGGLLVLVVLFLVVRAAVEIVTVDLSKPETYRQDWGGPHYLGVMLVHVGPGLLAVVLATIYLRRRSRKATAQLVGRRERSLTS